MQLQAPMLVHLSRLRKQYSYVRTNSKETMHLMTIKRVNLLTGLNKHGYMHHMVVYR
jgi:hypothetical protein